MVCVQNDSVILEALKHVVRKALSERASTRISVPMNAPLSAQEAKLKILSCIIDILDQYKDVTSDYLRATDLGKIVRDVKKISESTSNENLKTKAGNLRKKWKKMMGIVEPSNDTGNDDAGPKADAGQAERANGKRKREGQLDDQPSAAPSSGGAGGVQEEGEEAGNTPSSGVVGDPGGAKGGEPAAEAHTTNAAANNAAAFRKKEEMQLAEQQEKKKKEMEEKEKLKQKLRQLEERRKAALLRAMNSNFTEGPTSGADDRGREHAGARQAKKPKKSVRFREGADLQATKFFLRRDEDTTKLFDTVEMVGARQDEVVASGSRVYTSSGPAPDTGCEILWRMPEHVSFSKRDMGIIKRINFRKVFSDISDKYKVTNERFFKMTDSEEMANPMEDGDVAAVCLLTNVEPPIVIPLEQVITVGGEPCLQFQP